MGGGGRRDDDRIHGSVAERRIRRTFSGRPGLAGETGGAVEVPVDHVREGEARMRGDVAGVHGADNRESGHARVTPAPNSLSDLGGRFHDWRCGGEGSV